ncbi:glycosyltransferase family 2 protein [bacterium]|nr:glycosyltransferase family 2 protein [bacterium]
MKYKNKRPSPQLSICLLTRNQSEDVKQFLNSLLQDQCPELELLVRDDSDGEETEVVYKSFEKKFSFPTRYWKGVKEGSDSYDKALLSLTKHANGKYVFWFGDDQLKFGALKQILALTSDQNNYALIWLNASDKNKPSDQGFQVSGKTTFNSADDVININLGLLGFPSVTLLRRDLIAPHIDDATAVVGTTLSGFYLLMCAITKENSKTIYINDPHLLSRPKPSGEYRWYNSFDVHVINYAVVLNHFSSRINFWSRRNALSKHFSKVWRSVVYERAMGFSGGFATKEVKLWKMCRLYWCCPELILALPLMLLPRRLLPALLKIYKNTVKRPSDTAET